MQTQRLGLLTTPQLASHLRELVAAENSVVADIIECLVQFDERRGYLDLGYQTLHLMCLDRFGFSPDVAWKRIAVARAASRWPVLIDVLRAGKLNVLTVVMIAPHLDDFPDLIEAAQGKPLREVEAMIAARKPDRRWPKDSLRVQPVGPDAFKLEVVLTREQLEKLELAQGLSRHTNPDGKVAQLIEDALDALVATLKKRKFAISDRSRRPVDHEARRDTASVRETVRRAANDAENDEVDASVRETVRRAANDAVTAEVMRAVYRRDEGRCSYVGLDGRRCDAIAFVEIDHIVPRADDGDSSVGNLRLLCAPHNRAEARRLLGEHRVEAGRSIDHAMRERGRREQLLSDVESGLRNLGFSPAHARSATGRAAADHPGATSVEELIRPALAMLSPQR